MDPQGDNIQPPGQELVAKPPRHSTSRRIAVVAAILALAAISVYLLRTYRIQFVKL